MKIDLHSHSTCSDGTDSPSELLARAAAAGVDVLALTDHDTTEGWAEAEAAAEQHGITLVRGIEVSTRNGEHTQHLLAYEFDPSDAELVGMLADSVRSREERLPRMLELLRGEGFELDEAAIRASAAGTVSRNHVADALITGKHVPDRNAAFEEFLKPGAPAYVSRELPSIEDAIGVIGAAGGVTVVAHAWGRGTQVSRERFEELAAVGLTGIEVDHPEHGDEARSQLRRIADDLGLVATGGSDYHGERKQLNPLGGKVTTPVAYEQLLDLVRSGRPGG